MTSYRRISNKIGDHKKVLKGLIVVVTLCFLIVYSQGNVIAQDKDRSGGRTIYTIADGTVSDDNFDGSGDSILDNTDVIVGFGSYGYGELRGVYEFDISRIQNIPDKKQVILQFAYIGRHNNYSDYDLTLYACPGNTYIDLSDFHCDIFVTAFSALVEGPPSYIYIDVTSAVRPMILRGDSYVAFVIRPDPSSSNQTGSLHFNSIEVSANHGLPPAMLIIRPGK